MRRAPDKDTIIRLRNEGLSLREIGKYYGVSGSAVHQAFHRVPRIKKPARILNTDSKADRHRQDILAYIKTFQAEAGYPPTILEIAEALGMSKTGVHYHLGVMEQQGIIERQGHSARAMKVL